MDGAALAAPFLFESDQLSATNDGEARAMCIIWEDKGARILAGCDRKSGGEPPHSKK